MKQSLRFIVIPAMNSRLYIASKWKRADGSGFHALWRVLFVCQVCFCPPDTPPCTMMVPAFKHPGGCVFVCKTHPHYPTTAFQALCNSHCPKVAAVLSLATVAGDQSLLLDSRNNYPDLSDRPQNNFSGPVLLPEAATVPCLVPAGTSREQLPNLRSTDAVIGARPTQH